MLGDQRREGRRRRRGVEEATGRWQGVPRGDEHLSSMVLELERQTSTREFALLRRQPKKHQNVIVRRPLASGGSAAATTSMLGPPKGLSPSPEVPVERELSHVGVLPELGNG